jgi:hypothetical protein
VVVKPHPVEPSLLGSQRTLLQIAPPAIERIKEQVDEHHHRLRVRRRGVPQASQNRTGRHIGLHLTHVETHGIMLK